MSKSEFTRVSLWQYIRDLLFPGHNTSTLGADDTVFIKDYPRHGAGLSLSQLIEAIDTDYNAGQLSAGELIKYKRDVDYFISKLDNVSGAESARFMSELYEFQALIEQAEGDQDYALDDLESALSFNPDGTWLVSNSAIRWYKAVNKGDKPKKEFRQATNLNGTADFHNTWTEDISGRGYSPDSRFNSLRQRVFKRDGHSCVWCGSQENLIVDHIIERQLGGTNELNNLRTLCKNCHEEWHGRKVFGRSFDVDDDYGFSKKTNAKLRALVNAANAGKGICITYKDREGLKSVRVIHPRRIYKAKYIFVNAYCELDKEERVFRVSRMNLSLKSGNRYLNKSNSYTSSQWKGSVPFNKMTGKTIYARPTTDKINTD